MSSCHAITLNRGMLETRTQVKLLKNGDTCILVDPHVDALLRCCCAGDVVLRAAAAGIAEPGSFRGVGGGCQEAARRLPAQPAPRKVCERGRRVRKALHHSHVTRRNASCSAYHPVLHKQISQKNPSHPLQHRSCG